MPIKSWGPYTADAIASIRQQSYSQLELLLVTGMDHETVLDKVPSDARIRILKRRQPGIVSALNTGIEAAHGDYIARMDDDDLAHAHRLDTQFNYLERNPSIDICGTTIEFFSTNGSVQGGNLRYQHWLNQTDTPESLVEQLFVESPLPHPTWMAPARTWQTVGAYREFNGPEDYDWLLRAWLAGLTMGKTSGASNQPDADGPLLQWREHSERLTHRDTRYRREAFIQLKASTLCDARCALGLNHGRGIWIVGTGRNARYWCDALHNQQANVLGFVDLPSDSRAQQKRHLPVIDYEQLWSLRNDSLIITAITQPMAKGQLLQWFDQHRLVSMQDYVIGG